MRKKLLSLLTVLCLVLGMLPTTAMAAATEAYEKNEVARVITTDTEITEDVDGLVLVDAPCTVTVADAKLSVGIVVSPDAAGATVILSGAAEAAEVVVLAAASVKVEESANAGLVTVDAAEAELEIAGSAEITLTENAADVTVTAVEGAAVTVDAAEGSSVAVDVAEGAAVTMTVAEGASAAVTTAEGAVVTLDVAEGATVSIDVAEGADVSITAADPDAVEVTGAGAESVTINGETTADEEEKEEEEEAKDEEEDEGFDFNAPVIDSGNSVQAPRIVWAPLNDHSNPDNTPAGDETSTLTSGTHSATPGTATALTNGGTRVDVTLKAEGLKEHTNADGNSGYWIGFGIPLPEGTTTASSPYHYYYVEKSTMNDQTTWTALSSPADRFWEDSGILFNTIYFDVGYNENDVAEDATIVEATEGTDYIILVTKDSETPSEETPDIAESDLSGIEFSGENGQGEEVVYVFDVTIEATLEVEEETPPVDE